MSSTSANDPRADGDGPTPDEQAELRCLDFLLVELDRLRDRGLLPESSHAVARREALDRREAVLDRLRPHAGPAATAEDLVIIDQVVPAEDVVALARDAIKRGDDEKAIAECRGLLEREADHYDATVLLAFALQRKGRLDEALELYRRLQRREPRSDVWAQWVRDVARRRAAIPATAAGPALAMKAMPEPVELFSVPEPKSPTLPAAAPTAPRISWSAVAGEFLQDHWQKLILCLAVLLIVVSSNVGAYQLLGDQFWSPATQGVLALVYMALIAGFGRGLQRWGAGRAGRIMLLTTLFVVPAAFMMAGQWDLAARPTASGLAMLGGFALALLLLTRWVVSGLGVRRSAWGSASALIGLSIWNMAVARGSTLPWAWHFSLFLAPAVVYLVAVDWLTARYQGDDPDSRLEVSYFGLVLLTFAFLTGVARTGGFVLGLVPTLYAVPVMLTGIAGVRTSRSLGAWDVARERASWLRLGGLALAGVALALALARPPGASPLFSGNTLATAVLGFLLFAGLLIAERHPAYLYVGFGTLVVAYFGAFYFVRDLVHALEETVRQAMGYSRPLPPPFKAINGLVFNALLAGLALGFRRYWRDDRLARHCHWLGIPLAVACCVFSGFEPKAAVICLSGYTVLFALGVGVFSEPRLIYLSAGALAGAAYFGSTLVGGTTLAHQALLAALVGLGEWALGAGLRVAGFSPSYRRPLVHASLAMGLAATGLAAASALPAGPASPLAAGALLIAAALAVLANREGPHPALVYMAATSGSLAYAFAVLHAGDRVGGLTYAQFALATASAATGLALLSARLGAGLKDAEGPGGSALAVYPGPLGHVALAEVALALAFCGVFLARYALVLTPTDHGTLGAALGVAAAALIVLAGVFPTSLLIRLGLLCGLGAWVALVRAGLPGRVETWADFAAVTAGYTLTVAAGGLALWLQSARRVAPHPDDSRLGLFLRAFPRFVVSWVIGAVGLAVWGGTNGPATIAAFAMGSAALLVVTWAWRVEVLVDAGVALALMAVLCLTAWRTEAFGWGVTHAWFAAATTALAVVVRGAGLVAGRFTNGLFYTRPLERDVSVLAWLVVPFALYGPLENWRTYPVSATALVASAGVLLHLTRSRSRPSLTYRAVLAVVLAVYVVLLCAGTPRPGTEHVPGMVGVALSILLQGVGFAGRSRPDARREWIYFKPAFHSALLLSMLGSGLSFWSPTAMLLSAVSFVLMVKGLNSRNWLYPAVVACGSALYHGYLVGQPVERLAPAAIVVAYQLWIVALFWQRVEAPAVRWLGLTDRRYDLPLFNSALASALLGGGLRLAMLDGPADFSETAGVALNLSVFALLMTRPYPAPAWVHGSVVLGSIAGGLWAYPRIEAPAGWLSVVMGLAIAWQLAALVTRRFGTHLTRWLDVRGPDFFDTFDVWSRAFFTIALVLAAGLVCLQTAATMAGISLGFGLEDVGAWWAALLALGLGVVFVVETWWAKRRADALMGLAGLAVLAVWWACVERSPSMARLGLTGATCLPPATALMALGAVSTAAGLVRSPGGSWRFWASDPSVEPGQRLDAFSIDLGLLLSAVSAMMAMLATRPVAATTWLIAALALGLAAAVRRWVLAGYGSGTALCAAAAQGGLVIASRYEIVSGPDRVVVVAAGLLAAVAVLWSASGLLRRYGTDPEGAFEPGEVPARSVALALEQTALVAAIFCASGVGSTVLGGTGPTDRAALAAVGVLAGLALLSIGLLLRWGATWLVYMAEAALVGSFLYYRHAFPLPAAADATLLTLLGYLHFGLAEALDRIGGTRFAGPTRRFALALPLLPLVLGATGGPLGSFQTFLLFGAATFYGLTCFRLESRWLGYAAGVLYNAALWVLWWKVGWKVADHPPYFLVPAGLTAILFAEVNRGSMRREALNAIRGVGLCLVYLSLAAPIWEHQSLGAWVLMLLLSLAGIFAGIGLRAQTFLWLGLASFILDVVYQLGRVGMEHALAKWAIMLVLGVGLVVFVALNEKKQVIKKMKGYLEHVRQWE